MIGSAELSAGTIGQLGIAATASVLAQELVQPPAVRFYTIPITRSEYTVGVEGCGQRAYVVLCPQGGGCFAADGEGPVGGRFR